MFIICLFTNTHFIKKEKNIELKNSLIFYKNCIRIPYSIFKINEQNYIIKVLNDLIV